MRQTVVHEDGFDMEQAVFRALALLELMARQDCVLTERRKGDSWGSVGAGMLNWSSDLCRVLHRDFEAARQTLHNAGDKIAASRKLYNTVGKVKAFLMMLAHDLSSTEYMLGDDLRPEVPDKDIAPILSLVCDSIEYLEASFYDKFGRHLPMDQIDREIANELLAKFSKPEERRAA